MPAGSCCSDAYFGLLCQLGKPRLESKPAHFTDGIMPNLAPLIAVFERRAAESERHGLLIQIEGDGLPA